MTELDTSSEAGVNRFRNHLRIVLKCRFRLRWSGVEIEQPRGADDKDFLWQVAKALSHSPTSWGVGWEGASSGVGMSTQEYWSGVPLPSPISMHKPA